eukprot:2425404-Amphidinium_carterae.1
MSPLDCLQGLHVNGRGTSESIHVCTSARLGVVPFWQAAVDGELAIPYLKPHARSNVFNTVDNRRYFK